MAIEVSVIIVSYNRYPLNKLTLYSLKKQDFDLSKVEVIFVDDASTDRTPTLEKYRFPFTFQYVRNSQNLGRARSRNVGIQKARGKVLLFLDAEAIVEPNNISLHYAYHQKYNKAVVTGGNFYKLYSYLLPEFNEWEKQSIEKFMHKNEKYRKKVLKRLTISTNDFSSILNTTKPVKVIGRRDIKRYKTLRKLSEPKIYESRIIKKLGNKVENYHLSWLYCIGLNKSVRKSFIEEVGSYDENFQGWGAEDYEFGYRLTKGGAIYFADPNIYVYHQEHPVGPTRDYEAAKNIVYFQEKHPDIDVCIKSLQFINLDDANVLEDAVRDYYRLEEGFQLFKDTILKMLQEIPKIVSNNDLPISNLLERVGISYNTETSNQLIRERDLIASSGKCETLVMAFDKLTSL
ncbi:glycosyltransferase family 2 protein [Anaerobacillus sp. CMMVII]|uniref:glycosyltransferase family 2 protein n=1 Tax=Anaerobacillus sp. CMMVII TaxID=2755588 RepID=UPI0021B754C8|nr:glycosyltransferase family 2 protein [Anaerobacillus sp. CMMVII]MCT8137615.1 glycosyltransferase family 2 protein [Anaerobacillus sp. CMMVII]